MLDNELNNNLPLAEKLIYHNLLDHFTTEEIASKLRSLGQKIIAYKVNNHSIQEVWTLSLKLEQHPIFVYVQDKFDLFDSIFIVNIPDNNFYLIFNSKIVYFLPQLDINKIISSKFYRQLQQKNNQAANLLNSLFANQNQYLYQLYQFSLSMGMNIEQQDYFYAVILNNWKPNYDQAKYLLIGLLELILEFRKHPQSSQQISFNNFNTVYSKTCNYFTSIKPELYEIFNQFSQGNFDLQTWDKLANILYPNKQEALEFLDKFLGVSNEFKSQILKKWLVYIYENKQTIVTFTQNSHAWISLQKDEFNGFLKTVPEYAIILTRCLRESQRFDWIQADLLHYLGDIWIKQKNIDEDFKQLISTPSVAINSH
ncbi:MAG: hypothetical protein F6K62_27150 [Sphaerospermopsis sp. SIO1G2]|nr:hypothetical protein [Sphaerospermopsis sp. SIO1G2]